MEIYLHSYSFRDYSLDEALRAAKAYGYDGVELHGIHFNASYPAAELAYCLQLAADHESAIRCVDFKADLVQDDERAVAEAVSSLKTQVETTAKRGILRMNGFTGFLTGAEPGDFSRNGSHIATDTHYARCAEAMREVAGTAEQFGVTMTLEIHMNTIHDTVASTARLLDMIGSDRVLAAPDPGNMYATCADDRRVEALDALRGRIGYLHLKNCRLSEDGCDFSVKLADGHIDTRRYLKRLRALGYTGPVCLEYVGQGDPHVPAEADIAYVKRCIEWLSEA